MVRMPGMPRRTRESPAAHEQPCGELCKALHNQYTVLNTRANDSWSAPRAYLGEGVLCAFQNLFIYLPTLIPTTRYYATLTPLGREHAIDNNRTLILLNL